MRRRTVVLLVGLVVVVLGAVAVVIVLDRTSENSDPVAVTEAVARFREGGRGRGVYLYDTTGYERLSALGGRRHDYPRLTTITVTQGSPGCEVGRWDALATRWTEVETCDDEVRSITESRQFFGQTREKKLVCDRSRCTAEDETLDATVTVVGTEPVDVGGVAVGATHVRREQRHTGARDGVSTVDEWLRPSDGLVLRRRVRADVTIGTRIGKADYHEEYELRLRSLEPRR